MRAFFISFQPPYVLNLSYRLRIAKPQLAVVKERLNFGSIFCGRLNRPRNIETQAQYRARKRAAVTAVGRLLTRAVLRQSCDPRFRNVYSPPNGGATAPSDERRRIPVDLRCFRVFRLRPPNARRRRSISRALRRSRGRSCRAAKALPWLVADKVAPDAGQALRRSRSADARPCSVRFRCGLCW